MRHHQRGARELHREVAMVERAVVLALEPDLEDEHDDCVEQLAAVLDDHRTVLGHYEREKLRMGDVAEADELFCCLIFHSC